MPEPLVESHVFQAKWYINAFPKSGTHWLALMLHPVAKPQPEAPLWDKPWVGTNGGNSWADLPLSSESVLYRLGRLDDGCFLYGHCEFRPEIERFLYYLGVAHLFLYRDMRDVAVSQTHHILSEDDEKHFHPAKDFYRSLGGFDEVLEAVIEGVEMETENGQIRFPGVMERWMNYASWLRAPMVYRLRYEDLHQDCEGVMAGILDYGLKRVAPIFGSRLNFHQETFDFVVKQMVFCGQQTDKSATFREGKTGGWRKVFKPHHVDAFRKSDKACWLERLNYGAF